jgi:hypothetical protein
MTMFKKNTVQRKVTRVKTLLKNISPIRRLNPRGYAVRKMSSILPQIELIPKMQTDIARKFKLKALHLEARKFKLCL